MHQLCTTNKIKPYDFVSLIILTISYIFTDVIIVNDTT